MGYITEFISATAGELALVVNEQNAVAKYSGFEAAFSVDTLELARLWCLLEGETTETAFDARADALDDAYAENDDGVWAVALPKVFVSKVAGLSDDQADAAVRAWAASAEFKSKSLDDVRGLLQQLRALAGEVEQSGTTIIVRVGE